MLDYAWNPEKWDLKFDLKKWNEGNLRDYYTKWAEEQFGNQYATKIGDIIRQYSQYAARRKPELIDANTYSLDNYNEFERVVAQWKDLLQRAEKINAALPSSYHDAYFQLVLHPIRAMENLHEMYHNVALNRRAFQNKDISANNFADKAKQLYIQDSLLGQEYNHMNNGKWNHMMDQTHIGYTYWQQPPFNKMPEVKYIAATDAKQQTLLPAAAPKSFKDALPANITHRNLYYEQDGYVSINAAHFTKAVNTNKIQWQILTDAGREAEGIEAFPVTAAQQIAGANSPHLEYDVYLIDTGI